MKTNDKHEVPARRSLVLVGLLVAALCFAGPSRAQSRAATEPAPAAPGATQQPPALPPSASASTAKPASAAGPATAAGGKKAAKGRSERVKVLGYWKIEVYNPAGKLVSHTEFENSLTTNDPNGSSGDFALAEILSGGNSRAVFSDPTTGNSVDLISTGYATGSVQGFLANARVFAANGAPFKSLAFNLPFLSIGLNTAPILSGLTGVVLPGGGLEVFFLSPGFTDGSVASQGSGPCANAASSPPAFGCLVPTSQVLNTSPGGTTGATGNQVVLTGSFQVQASTTITQVGTYVTPVQLVITNNGSSMFTNGQFNDTLNAPAAYSLTWASLSTASPCTPTPQAPCAVFVTAGQTVSVTVTLSFQ